jgi:hypothetical protein
MNSVRTQEIKMQISQDNNHLFIKDTIIHDGSSFNSDENILSVGSGSISYNYIKYIDGNNFIVGIQVDNANINPVQLYIDTKNRLEI